jgi:hypothetical protein
VEHLRRLAVVFVAVPIRLKIVTELYQREMSPKQFYEEFGGGSVSRLAQHFERLVETGWLRQMWTEGPGGKRRETFAVRPDVTRLEGERPIFADGGSEEVDAIVLRHGLPGQLPVSARPARSRRRAAVPLYRRILSPHADNLAFIGILDAGPGRLELVERQAQWLSKVI